MSKPYNFMHTWCFQLQLCRVHKMYMKVESFSFLLAVHRFAMNCVFCFLCIFLAFFSASATFNGTRKYDAIYSFGDSLTDTGNFLRTGAVAYPVIARLPYGETFFRHPTGRCSDGRLVVDFLAEAYKLPFLPPYLGLPKGHNTQHGVNFAVAGATALDPKFFQDRKLGSTLWTKGSLNIQLGWFRNYKASLCKSDQGCLKHFKRSLFLVGEIGGNDYNYASLYRTDIEQLRQLTPLVIGAISDAVTTLIEEGAVALLVPGNFPVGCLGVYLTLFQSPNKADYDGNGCLKSYNEFSRYHNSRLKLALGKLRSNHPQAKIMYADFYSAAMQLYHSPKHHGFSNGALIACCGGGGPYNFNNSARCGHVGSNACKDPQTYVSWDGIHLTEAAYRHIAGGLVSGEFSSMN